MTSRKEIEFNHRREWILDCAEKIFAQKGYHSTSINEIAEQAEFATGSIYKYFNNKENLYFNLLYRKMLVVLTILDECISEKLVTKDTIRNFITKELAFFRSNADFFRLISKTFKGENIFIEAEMNSRMQELHFEYIDKLSSLFQNDNASTLKDIPPVQLAVSLMGIINEHLFMWVNCPERCSNENIDRYIFEIFWEGAAKKENVQ